MQFNSDKYIILSSIIFCSISDKYCHKSLQVICREKSKDVRIKVRYPPFVSMQDFYSFRLYLYSSAYAVFSYIFVEVLG